MLDVRRILKIDDPLVIDELYLLTETIEDQELSVDAVVKYMTENLESIGVFGIFDGDALRGFIYVEPPVPFYPNRGYLYIVAIDPIVPISVSKKLFTLSNDWLMENGATYLWGWT